MKRLQCLTHNQNGKACLADLKFNSCEIIEEDNFVPSDCKEQTEAHLTKGGGCCGQTCLAVIERSTIKEVFGNWEKLGFEWKGYTPNKQLRAYLQARGYRVKLVTTKNKTNMQAPFYIVRIVWEGEGDNKEKPYYGYGHWAEAAAHSHFVVKEGERFFCNESGWMDKDDFQAYLDCKPKGNITSLLEVRR